jgi:hypothetical protein
MRPRPFCLLTRHWGWVFVQVKSTGRGSDAVARGIGQPRFLPVQVMAGAASAGRSERRPPPRATGSRSDGRSHPSRAVAFPRPVTTSVSSMKAPARNLGIKSDGQAESRPVGWRGASGSRWDGDARACSRYQLNTRGPCRSTLAPTSRSAGGSPRWFRESPLSEVKIQAGGRTRKVV